MSFSTSLQQAGPMQRAYNQPPKMVGFQTPAWVEQYEEPLFVPGEAPEEFSMYPGLVWLEENPKLKPLPKEESTEPVVGWRYWKIHRTYKDLIFGHWFWKTVKKVPEDVFLVSPSRGTRWDGPILRADAVPEKNSWKGIFAHDSRTRANYARREGLVTGEVEGFGTVIVHETGFRAEAVRIKRLFVNKENKNLVELLSKRYQCDVEVV